MRTALCTTWAHVEANRTGRTQWKSEVTLSWHAHKGVEGSGGGDRVIAYFDCL